MRRATLSLVTVTALSLVAPVRGAAAAAGPRPCSFRDAVVTTYGVSVAAGTVGELFWIAATGARACTVHGYARVSFTGTYGTAPSRRARIELAVAQSDHRRRAPIAGVALGRALPTATVSPGGPIASFWIFGTDEPHVDANGTTSRCILSGDMSLRLPGDANPLTVTPARNMSFDWCGPVELYPVVPGDTGSDPPFPLDRVIARSP
ncbi:MAG: hypothetical protein KGJ36_00530 [Acidobacteriota bacterium]|nr:hypothetical protein [Acidobacteriota bacterium]